MACEGLRKPDNNLQSAVAVITDGEVVGHVTYNLAPTVSQFLRRETATKPSWN